MCLNGWGGKLHDELLGFVHSQAPDILCMQEVVHSPVAKKDWLTYRDGDRVLSQRANFFRDLCHVLPDHKPAFCPVARGVLWDVDQSIPSEWGLATFVRHSIPIIGQVQGFVHKDYSPFSFGDHPRPRNAHGVRVYDEWSNRMISITQMHGMHDLIGKMDTPARTTQALRLLELSNQLSRPDDLVVVCGDFNVEANSETLRILKDAGFVELVTRRRFLGTRTSYYKKPGRFADYMLINEIDAVKCFDVIYEPEVSDHCPLILTL